MKTWLRRIAFGLAVLLVALTVYNASWIAPTATGSVKLIAHRGAQQIAIDPGDDADCAATRIEAPLHPYLENTVAGIERAGQIGAVMIEADIAPTADGEIVLFRDADLNCRTDGTGAVRNVTLAQMQRLDAGYGYTVDGSERRPFRGRGVGAIPTLEEALKAAPNSRMLFHFASNDPGEADLLASRLERAGVRMRYTDSAFYGPAGPVERLRELYPDIWAFTPAEAESCASGYLLSGWLGGVPQSCMAGKTMFVRFERQWLIPGWPNRTIQRMEEAGVQMIMRGPQGDDLPVGVDLPEQLGEVPATFNGWLWVEDIETVGPALRPSFNDRTDEEDDALARALERRRARR